METELLLSFFQTAINLALLLFVLFQLRQVNKSIQSSAQTSLYSQSTEVRKIILGQPELFPYLFEGKPLDPEIDKLLRDKIRIVGLLQLSYLENLITQEKNLNRSHHTEWLDTFIPLSLENSPVMVEILKENPDVYCKKLISVCKQLNQ
jgi:hypothetical protein